MTDEYKNINDDENLEMTKVMDMCSILGLEEKMPSLILVGEISSGKSTLLEEMIGFIKMTYSAKERATNCPVRYFLQRKNESEQVTYFQNVKIENNNLIPKIKEHMEMLQNLDWKNNEFELEK